MKLIDIMKRYNKCILKENAKLRSIYNTLIRECDGADAENECDANEAEGTKMSIAEFLGECDKEDGAKEGATDECDACGDDSCKDGEKCGLKEGEDEIEEDEELISKKEFYAANESDKEDKTNEDEEIEEEDEEEIAEEAEEEISEEDEETEKETNEDEDAEKDVTESKKDDKETELSESLEDHYRAANRKLFNV